MQLFRTFISILLSIVIGVLLTSYQTSSIKPKPIPFLIPKGWRKPVYDFSANPLTQEGVQLGRKLFYDPRLSKDGNFSCASCHQQFAAFATYDHALSHGVDNHQTFRNAPALQNLAWQKDFMLDGSIHSLHNQPISPITNPNEMGETLPNVLRKIQSDAVYKTMFKAAFGNVNVTTVHLLKALTQFMLTLVSSNSKYDKVMRKEDHFILPEQLGYAIFQQKCASCHSEPMFTDYSYRNIGIPADDFLKDIGRMKVTNNPKDSLKFRVPSLRNIAITAPYGHDGRFFSLYNVLEHYRSKMTITENTDSLLLHKIPLSNYEIGQLTAFLLTLTDTSFIQDKRFAPEGYSITPSFIHIH